eukprot:Phypoly_transcript_11101.p1 GENE.Phypoly_transcript_11101~~Phypoly_transcript_11101.p1  ORF type:complete len:329 (+),score=31.65 Phypoly_transcript_11101:67-1053(+)
MKELPSPPQPATSTTRTMSPLMRVAMVLLAIAFASTSFYAYMFFRESGGIITPTASAEHVNVTTGGNIDGNYMCNVAVAIYTAPQHASTRVGDARKSWTTRICPYGTPQYMFIGLPAELNIERSVDVPCNTDYFSLCCKSMEGLAKLYHAFPNADWYYKVDDDTLLVPRNVDRLLATLDSKDKLLLGYMIEAEIDATTKKFEGRIYEPRVEHHNGELFDTRIMYCSGSGYIMSGALVRGMMENMTHYKDVWAPICALYEPEDVAVGLFAAKFGARVAKIQGVYNKNWNWDEGPTDDTYEVVSVHLSRDTNKMVYFDRLLSGPTPKKKS